MKSKHYQLGFTFLELIIGMFVFSIVVAMIGSMFFYFFSNYTKSFEQTKTLSEVKVVTQDIFAQLREARRSEDGAYPLFIANDNEIGFYADIDKDGRVERVRYYLQGNSFYRAVIVPNDDLNPYDPASETSTLISNIVFNQDEPVFTYYNELYPIDMTNNPLPQDQRLLFTRLVEVRLRLSSAEEYLEPFEVTTQVMIRNLKSNY